MLCSWNLNQRHPFTNDHHFGSHSLSEHKPETDSWSRQKMKKWRNYSNSVLTETEWCKFHFHIKLKTIIRCFGVNKFILIFKSSHMHIHKINFLFLFSRKFGNLVLLGTVSSKSHEGLWINDKSVSQERESTINRITEVLITKTLTKLFRY